MKAYRCSNDGCRLLMAETEYMNTILKTCPKCSRDLGLFREVEFTKAETDPVLNLLREHLDQSRRENALLRTACRATLSRLENPLLDTSLFDDVKQLLRIALEGDEGS